MCVGMCGGECENEGSLDSCLVSSALWQCNMVKVLEMEPKCCCSLLYFNGNGKIPDLFSTGILSKFNCRVAVPDFSF